MSRIHVARLFEREEGNLAYEYANSYLRPKLGTQQVYQLKEGDISGDLGDAKEQNSEEEDDWKELLTKWGLKKFIDAMDDNGYDDPQFWHEITEEELVNDMGMKKGHLKKWNMQLAKYQDRRKLKEHRSVDKEQKEDEGGQSMVQSVQVVQQQAPPVYQPPPPQQLAVWYNYSLSFILQFESNFF